MATILPQDRLIRKEAALGFLRERAYPQGHIGLDYLAPMMDVPEDDVIFQYIQDAGTGMAPARAQDAEAEMAYKEDTFGEGRASIIDWAVKDLYTPSDVSRFRGSAYLDGLIVPAGAPNLQLTVSNIKEGFEQRVARDTALRHTKLMNRLEKLIMEALWTGQIAYNDSKIVFNVPFGRPSAQTSASASVLWDQTTADPIDDIFQLQQSAFDLYGITIDRAICSRRILTKMLTSSKFAARSGLAVAGGPGSGVIDPKYLIDGWGIDAAKAVIERATGVTFTIYDSVYRTRTRGATTLTNTRFSPDDKVLFLPSQDSIAAVDDMIGFGKMLTSPHPEGNWQSGFYEWEQELGPDPWGHSAGTGIKAFPVFPHLEFSWVMKVVANGTGLQAAY